MIPKEVFNKIHVGDKILINRYDNPEVAREHNGWQEVIDVSQIKQGFVRTQKSSWSPIYIDAVKKPQSPIGLNDLI